MSKLKIFPYSPKFPKIFEKEKERISKTVKNIEIHHIGSTAVPGLGGKGIIDIMIGIKDWKEAKNIIKKLRRLSFIHIHPQKNGRIFLSRDPNETKIGEAHIHIVKKESKTYKELLNFRDYLRKHPLEIKKFFNLKLKWLKGTKGERVKYFKLKAVYVRKILERVATKKN